MNFDRVETPSDTQVSFLALRAAAGAEQAALCEHLLAHPDLDEAMALSPWPVEERHCILATRQRFVLRLFGVHTVLFEDLPERLQQTRPRPAALFVRGNIALLDRPAVGIVGSRRASPGALAYATAQARAHVYAGSVVVSGGARGIDAAAHWAAIALASPSVAYLGSPIDAPYPAAHKALFRRILQVGGALVSEHPPGVPTNKYHHAARNRFIAAHADTILVVEAAEGSGSLGTALHARRLGRAIFVPPSNVGGEREGIDALLRGGHACVSEPCPSAINEA